jgi:hypothetical protein
MENHENTQTKNLVLVGDSVFDNQVYVDPGQDSVTKHLNRKLEPLNWRLDMRAVDGAVVSDVQYQLGNKLVPTPCTFVMSAGGNDALQYLDQIAKLGLMDFYEIKERFREEYIQTLNELLEYGQPLIVCTIYNPKIPEPQAQKMAEAGLSFFNDVICEEALRRDIPIIDLRDVCSEASAFANPIEPSEIGGDLITDVIISKLSN